MDRQMYRRALPGNLPDVAACAQRWGTSVPARIAERAFYPGCAVGHALCPQVCGKLCTLPGDKGRCRAVARLSHAAGGGVQAFQTRPEVAC